ncbi:MAG: hypothetical protein OXH60_10575 [Rhodospirillales bacterium]|nr:hypothetical protein [Rhodospirillales bacterium]
MRPIAKPVIALMISQSLTACGGGSSPTFAGQQVDEITNDPSSSGRAMNP